MSIIKNSNLLISVCRIFFVSLDDVSNVLMVPDRFHRTVILKSGTQWQEIYFTAGTAEFTEKSKVTDAGELIDQSLKFIFPGEDESNLLNMDSILGPPVIVKIGMPLGYKIIGDINCGAKLQQNYQISAKSTGSQFEFTCTATYRSCWLNS